MPKKYTTKKPTYRKKAGTFRKRTGGRYRTTTSTGGARTKMLSTNSVGFPNRFPTKLMYVASYNQTNALGVQTTQVFTMNGMFDVDITSIGHQPMYYDQFADLYTNYLVYGCLVDITAIPANEEAWELILRGSNTNDSSSYTIEAMREHKGVVRRLVTGNTNITRIKKYYNIPRYLGKTITTLRDSPLYNVANTSNPSDLLYWNLTAQTLSGAVASIYIEYRITYYCEWTQLRGQIQS